MAQGVYYRETDYAGVWRRLFIDLVDAVVVVVVASVAWFAYIEVLLGTDNPSRVDTSGLLLVALPSVAFAYLVLLKRTSVRTVGYRLAGVRIVNLQGQIPGVLSLSLRLLFAIFGPLNLLVDLAWIPGDRARQAVRDKFAHTYVIRSDAQPEGTGPIKFQSYFLACFSFLFQEVTPGIEPDSAATS